MEKYEFQSDKELMKRYDTFFIIKNGDDVIFEPKRCAQYTCVSPFEKGFIPRVGDEISIQNRKWRNDIEKTIIEGYETADMEKTEVIKYKVDHVYLQIVEQFRLSYKSIVTIEVSKV